MRCGAALQNITPPTDSVVDGQVTTPAIGSSTWMLSSVTLPVFSTRKVHWIVSPKSVDPGPLTSATAAFLVSAGFGRWDTEVEAVEGWMVTVAPDGARALAVTVLSTWP